MSKLKSSSDPFHSSTVYLYVLNEPVIESSSNLKFAPYNVAYPLLDQHAAQVGFDPSKLRMANQVKEVNKWDLIFDFTKDDQKLNYQFLDPAEFKIITKELEGIPEKAQLVFAFPERYGGTIPDDANFHELKENDDSLMAFSINVSQQEASRKVQEVEEKQQTPQKVEEQQNDDFDMFMGASQSSQ